MTVVTKKLPKKDAIVEAVTRYVALNDKLNRLRTQRNRAYKHLHSVLESRAGK